MKRFIILIAAIALSVSGLLAQNQAMPQLPNDPAVRKGKLENGMTYYIRHNELPANRAEFYLATDVGAIQETPDQDGLAHFLEHMCFNGTKNFPGKGILDYLQTIGASFGGNVNASTGVEQTIYMLTNIPLVNESVVDSCILIMHDYSHFVTLDPEEIDKERGVILEERRQGMNAARRVYEKAAQYYYGGSKYSNCTIIGSEENLKNFKPESIENFYKTWYRPDMQALIVVGDVDVDAVEQKIKAIFSDIPAAVNPQPKEMHKIPGNVEPQIGIITDPELTSSSIEVLWKSDAAPEEINSTIVGKLNDVVESIVGAVMSERFADITAKPDAPYLSAYLGIGGLCETADIVNGSVTIKDGEAIPAFKAFMTEVEKMKRFGFTEAEVQRAKDNLLARYESAAQKADTRKNPQFVREYINNFFDNETYMDPKVELDLVKTQIFPMLNAQILNQIVSQIITDENMVVIYTAPEKEGLAKPTEEEFLKVIAEVKAAEIQANVEETTATELLDATALKGSAVKKTADGVYGSTEWTLKNGLKVILKPTDFEKDRISIDLYKNGGMSLIPTEDIASFEDNVWSVFKSNSGVSDFPLTTLNKMLSGKNVGAAPYISSLRHGIQANSNVKDLETAFQIVYLMFVDPRFDEDEYAQGMTMLNSILPNLVNQPNYKLQVAMTETFFGGHPRAAVISEEVLANASLETIEKNYRKLFNDAAGATALIVGDFKIEEIKPLVEKYLGSIPKGKKALNWEDDGVHLVKGNVLNDFKATMETPVVTVLDVYSADLPYNQENVVAMKAVSYILGMRYTTSLREEAGGTYGASVVDSYANAPKEQALIQIYFNSSTEMADKLRELVIEGMQELIENGPTASEFEMTVNNLQKNIPERKITNAYWATALREHDLFGLETVDAYEAAVKALTPEKIQAIAKALVEAGNHAEIVMRPAE